MSAAGIHAPWVNLDTTTITAIRPVVNAPMALMVRLRFHRGSRRRRWWMTMPVWLSVNPVNTPKA